ncbi:MAG: gamma subclass chorismate mutase AroQ, partial [Planctomycetes bacterium]|nr:gamma subclass chorismate mutase AroQ [Planctomycetota bacterium]
MPRMAYLLVPLLLGLTSCRPAPPPKSADPATIDRLLRAMNARLAVMEEVAKFKWAGKKPIADPDREAALLHEMEELAKEQGLAPTDARWFFAAQIEAAKVVQENLIEQWRKENQSPSKNAVDLVELRKRIDTLNRELLKELAEYRKQPIDQ